MARNRTITGSLKADQGISFKRLVDEKTGKVADIRLDKKRFLFHCSIEDEYFDSKDGREVEAWAAKIIAIPDGKIEWQGVIEVSLSSNIDRFGRRRHRDGDQECSVDFDLKFDRWHIGKTPVGHWKQMSWAQLDPKSPKYVADPIEQVAVCTPFEDGERIENPHNPHVSRGYVDKDRKPRPFKLPFSETGSSTSLLAYDEALWNGLNAIASTIEREGEMIRRLLGSTDGHAAIRAYGEGGPLQLEALSSASKKKGKAKA